MTIITINLDDDQIDKANIIARLLRLETGENVSRSEVFRMAIDLLHAKHCPKDTDQAPAPSTN